jgi:hypothetical protein
MNDEVLSSASNNSIEEVDLFNDMKDSYSN